MPAKDATTCNYCQSLRDKLARAEQERDASAALDCRVLLTRHEGQGHPLAPQTES